MKARAARSWWSATRPIRSARYYAEILRAEGLNAFTVDDITTVDATLLNDYEVVILGEMSLSSAAQVTTVRAIGSQAGGNLIAMRPDNDLAGLLGLTDASSALWQTPICW